MHAEPHAGFYTTSRDVTFVDGCFWHGCPQHPSWPTSNAEWWRTKITGNRLRDADTDRRLAESGWAVIRVWEHENASAAAERVRAAVLGRADR